MKIRNQKGFSLIELMVVVAIIGILAAIAIPNFNRYQAKARRGEGKGYLAALYTGEQSFYAEWGSYYGNMDSIGVSAVGKGSYRVGFSATNAVPAGYTAPPAKLTVAPPSAYPNLPIPGGLNGTAACAAAAFTGQANGQITAGAVTDTWTITQANVLAQVRDGT